VSTMAVSSRTSCTSELDSSNAASENIDRFSICWLALTCVQPSITGVGAIANAQDGTHVQPFIAAEGAALRVDSGGAASTTAIPGYAGCTAAKSTGGAIPVVDPGGAPLKLDSGGVMSELDLGEAVSTDIESGGAMFTCSCTRCKGAICAAYAQDVVHTVHTQNYWKNTQFDGSTCWPLLLEYMLHMALITHGPKSRHLRSRGRWFN
jgi:hypothetical protein